MIYRDYEGIQLSGLGLGMMRLPVVDGNDGVVDEKAAEEMIDYAYKNGINYFDTAWGYHGEKSELVAGKYLSKYPRDSYHLATKFPGYDNSNMPKVKEIFEKQLEKCRTDYFDFYLFHNVYEGNIDDYLDPKFGILVLSGMSSLEQLRENITTWEADKPLTGGEFDRLVELADEDTKKAGLPCTACHYCTGHCPKKLPIPELIALYNEHKITGSGFLAPMAVASMDEALRPANCIGCRSCEKVCPQQIKISEAMKDFSGMIGM